VLLPLLLLLLQVKMSAGDEITITDKTRPNTLQVRVYNCFLNANANYRRDQNQNQAIRDQDGNDNANR